MQLDPASGKKILDITSGKRSNMILPAGKDGNGSCQREKMELDPASQKIGTGSYQRKKMELDPATGKIWNCILSRGKLGTTVDPASEKT
jgi:hypothetical protein